MNNALSLLLEPIKHQFHHKEINGINARNLHQALQVKREFSHWIKARIKQCRFVEGQDFIFEGINLSKSTCIENNQFTSKLTEIISVKDNQLVPQRGKTKAGRPEAHIIITIDMAKHLCLLEKNEVGHAIRQHFIEAEKQLAEIASKVYHNTLERTKARLEAIDHNRAMTDAITAYYHRQGKELKPYHYSNEQEMLDSLVLGENVRKWKAQQGAKNARDDFTTEQLKHLKALQQINTSLLMLDMPYLQRKALLKQTVENRGQL